jgi:nucleoside phosphorylase
LVSIAASEKPVFDEKDLIQFSSNMKNKNIGEKFVDMESYGFEMVCDSFSLPRIILKVPVDKI